ncbi:hypothetical protein ACFTS5_33305 [Nocardia sp. NPDC056952]|uniref:hypothetical protein n=1 Tax=Nocardia sp. NPDC056952 TaxID=3345979 RepID=UPI0036317D6A
MVRRRSPQEKKSLSYAKDRRNGYGENDKSSRKNIPRNKRIRNRADRHRDSGSAEACGPVDLEAAEEYEVDLLARSKWQTARWQKKPDIPLRAMVAYKLRRRAHRVAMAAERDKVGREAAAAYSNTQGGISR